MDKETETDRKRESIERRKLGMTDCNQTIQCVMEDQQKDAGAAQPVNNGMRRFDTIKMHIEWCLPVDYFSLMLPTITELKYTSNGVYRLWIILA